MTIYPILLYFFDMMNLDKLKENKKKELLDIFEKLYKNSSYKTLNEKEKIDFIVEEGFDDLELFDSSNSSKLDIKEFYKIIVNFEEEKEENYIITPNTFFKKLIFLKKITKVILIYPVTLYTTDLQMWKLNKSMKKVIAIIEKDWNQN